MFTAEGGVHYRRARVQAAKLVKKTIYKRAVISIGCVCACACQGRA